jgi:hypothetical protein
MFGETIPIPAPRVEPVALEAASRGKTVAAVLFFVAAVFVFAAVGMVLDGTSNGGRGESSMVAGVLFWLVMIALVAMRFVKNAARATAAARRAKVDPSSRWFLVGNTIVGGDSTGAPRPDLTFKISNKLRAMLLAVPRATVVDGAFH